MAAGRESPIDEHNNCFGDYSNTPTSPRGIAMAKSGARLRRLQDGHDAGPAIGLGSGNLHNTELEPDYDTSFDYGFSGLTPRHP